MRQEHIMKLFEDLEEPVYEQVLEFLKGENFTVKGFRDIRKLSKNLIVRDLYRKPDVLRKTLFLIQEIYEVRDCFENDIRESLENGDFDEFDVEELMEKFPEKKNGFLASCLLSTPKAVENALRTNPDFKISFTEEEKECIKEMDSSFGMELYNEYIENLISGGENPEQEEEIPLKEVDADMKEMIDAKEDNDYWKEKYNEEKQRNKELSKKNKSQKMELGMLKEEIQKKEKQLKEKEERKKRTEDKMEGIQKKWTEEQERIKELEKQIREMKEVIQRDRILYIGMTRNLELYSKEFQIDVLEEEDLDWRHLQLEHYAEIWLVDNEIASLYQKRYIRKKASELGIKIHTFYGDIQLIEYVRRKKKQRLLDSK